MRLSALAAAYGTPAFILDEGDVRYRCRTYMAALPGIEVAYAGNAFLCRAMARWIAAEGLSLAICSAGELAVAQAVNFPAELIILHGNAKTPADLRAALRYGVDRIVVDSTAEIIRLAALTPRPQRVLIQVTPGQNAHGDRSVEDHSFCCPPMSGRAIWSPCRAPARTTTRWRSTTTWSDALP